MPFEFESMAIPAVVLVKPRLFSDDRGFFVETYKRSEFAANGIGDCFVQDNHSHSVKNVLRGLHFQRPPQAQGKLVSAVFGRVFDVAVDLRPGSPTWGKWVAAILSASDAHMLYVPPGFAHGFCVLSDEADVTYKVTAEYAPQLDAGILWNDPDIGIDWPIDEPLLSQKDAALPRLRDLGRRS